jgi:hypothetical protein
LLALDWLNGNRCILQNTDLSGLIVGITLSTTTEHIYRALIESTAYGLKMIVKAITDAGMTINEIYACGGLARKSSTIIHLKFYNRQCCELFLTFVISDKERIPRHIKLIDIDSLIFLTYYRYNL